jgi:hypothetical protein
VSDFRFTDRQVSSVLQVDGSSYSRFPTSNPYDATTYALKERRTSSALRSLKAET